MSVVSQFITVASFSFSDVEDSLTEAKELVRTGGGQGLGTALSVCPLLFMLLSTARSSKTKIWSL